MLFFVAAGITGAASFIYEIGWIRMLSLVLGATTHSFELMLSAFITGLAFGGLWIKRRIDGIRNPVAFAGWVQVIMGAMAILTVPLYVQTFDWMAVLLQGLDRSTAGYGLFTAASHAIALAVMVPTTFLAGMTLPLFTHVLMRGRHGEQAIGRVYAANTLGAIVGVLFAVHVGMPLLGLKNLIGLGAGLDIALGVALLYRSQERSANALALRGALAGAGMLAFIMATVDLDPKRLASGVYRYSVAQWGENVRVAYYKDGKTASVSLAAYGSEIALATNGKPDAFVQLDPELPRTVDEITMVMAGVLPLAYNPAARQVANVGLGSGLTTHTLLAHEGIELVDTVEIEAAMIEAAELGFGTRVGRAFSDPRSRIHLEDAKTFFSLHNRKYDVIVAEPSNPWVSGVASLFSEEFYRTVPNYLNEDGVLVQWLQLYEFDNGLVASVTKALAEHFRDYAIYHTDDTNILIVAKPHGMLPEPDFAKILDGPLGAEAAEVGLRNPADFLVRRTASARIINHWLAQSPIPANSDYFPYLDLNAGKARFLGEVVTVFLTWSVTPLPLLEMLDGSRVAVDDVSPTDRFRRTGLINNARSIYAAFTSDEDSAAHRLTPLAPALTTLHLLRRSCELPGFEESWVLGLHTLAESSLAFLDAHDATELLRAALPDRCREHRSQRLLAWYGLYQRIAARDAHGMGVAAEEVLKLDHVASAERRSYALAAAMLGRLCSGHPDRALALWDERVELVGDIEGMLDFQLIVAVAMSRQNGAGR
jgi:predicted membrane-bound spermidine synthase